MKKLTCSCGAAIDSGASAPGTRVRCPKCKKLIPVPPASTARATGKPPTRRVAAVPGRPARKAASKKTVLLGSAAALVVLVVALVMVLRNDDGGQKPTDADRAKKGAEEILKGHQLADADTKDPKRAKDWLAAARDARTNGFLEKYEEWLEVAAKLGPEDQEILSAYEALVRTWIDALLPADPDYADKYFAIGERVEAAGLKRLAEDIFIQIAGDGLGKRLSKVPGISPKHPRANKKLDRVLTDYGTYQDRELWEGIKDKLADMSKRDDILKDLPPWNKKAFLKKEQIEKRLGGKMTFKVVDQKPYLVAVQDSPKYAGELIAEDYRKVVETLYVLFREEYAKKFKIEQVFEGEGAEEVLPIIVYDSSDTYHAQNPQAPEWAGGHFSRRTGDIEIFQGVPDPYETIFHEGTHQLVSAATKVLGAKHTNTHWLTEGIACYFEAFKRDAQYQIHLGSGKKADDYLGEVQSFARKSKHLPFEKFVDQDYGTFMDRQEAMNPFERQVFVGLSYAQSWALVYFFRNHENGKYRDKFDEYFLAELKGEGTLDLFKKIFGDVKALEKEWLAYVTTLKPGS